MKEEKGRVKEGVRHTNRGQAISTVVKDLFLCSYAPS